MPALSGQSQTDKGTVCETKNKCLLASCRAERERERARERAGYFMVVVQIGHVFVKLTETHLIQGNWLGSLKYSKTNELPVTCGGVYFV